MSIKGLLRKIKKEVKAGRVAFRLTGIPVVDGGVNHWVESERPVAGLFPLCFLAERGLIPKNPPYGLSWEDYHQVVDTELDHDGAALRGDLLQVVGLSESKS